MPSNGILGCFSPSGIFWEIQGIVAAGTRHLGEGAAAAPWKRPLFIPLSAGASRGPALPGSCWIIPQQVPVAEN